jgi:hypothetical protein
MCPVVPDIRRKDVSSLAAGIRFSRPEAIYGAIQEIGGFDRPEWLD